MTGTVRVFLPLPSTVTWSRPLTGASAAGWPSASEMRTRPVEQRQHGCVAGKHPGWACLPGTGIGIGKIAAPSGSGFGKLRASFGAARPRMPSLPFPWRSREPAKERMPASARSNERLPTPRRRRRQKGAKVGSVQRRNDWREGASPRWSVRNPRNWRRSRAYASAVWRDTRRSPLRCVSQAFASATRSAAAEKGGGAAAWRC